MPYRILFTGRRTLSELVDMYLSQGNIPAAVILYIIAKHGRVTLARLREELRRLGIEVTQSRIGSLITTWKMHKFIETPVRGLYTVGPNLVVNQEELEKTRRLIQEKTGLQLS